VNKKEYRETLLRFHKRTLSIAQEHLEIALAGIRTANKFAEIVGKPQFTLLFIYTEHPENYVVTDKTTGREVELNLFPADLSDTKLYSEPLFDACDDA
jgi:hypothetical protein